MAEPVEIFEVGPRDGLQNEPRAIATADKIALVDLLSQAGFSRIEVASFVSPKWVPQMADSAAVLAGVIRKPGVKYTALTPNQRGLDRAIAAGADEVAVFGSASEEFSQKNINCSISESLERFAPMVRAANDANIQVRGYVSCVTDCPYEGPVAPQKVADMAQALADIGCYEISLGETLGRATPERICLMLEAVVQRVSPSRLAGHYHDTGGRALDSIQASLDFGLRVFDAAVGGLGGCPFAPGAAGNVATEAVHSRLADLGHDTGLNAKILKQAAEFARSLRINRESQ